jgi:predicted transcriptional regulator
MGYGYSIRLKKLNKEANPKLLGVRLGKACIKQDIPVHEVALQLGVSRQTVYNWFVGSSSPQKSVAETIKTFLHSLSQK